MAGEIMIGCGAVAAVWARWLMPRYLGRARAKVIAGGKAPDRFDKMLQSRPFRLSRVTMQGGGVALALAGVVVLFVE